MERKPPKFIAIPTSAPGSLSASSKGAQERMTNVGKQRGKNKAYEDRAVGDKGKSYGLVLKGGNPFVDAAGIIGAATAKVDSTGDAANLAPSGTCLIVKPPKGGGLAAKA